jgi:zinc transport system permease protein
MSEFLMDLVEFPFLRNALLAGIAASAACGVVGTYVVTRRITVIAGSLAHTVLGGMGAAYYLHQVKGWTWLHPLHGAIVAAVLAAVIIGMARSRFREREDTIISALWSIGMATGIMFLFKTPGYKSDLMTYLFGNITLVDSNELRLLVLLDILVIAIVAICYRPLLAVCHDEEFARLRGINVTGYHTLLLVVAALTIVSLIHVVGVVMVIALVTLPVSVAGRFTSRLWTMMILAAIFSALLTSTGLAVSYTSDLPTGATTILLAGLFYIVVHGGGAIIDYARKH